MRYKHLKFYRKKNTIDYAKGFNIISVSKMVHIDSIIQTGVGTRVDWEAL